MAKLLYGSLLGLLLLVGTVQGATYHWTYEEAATTTQCSSGAGHIWEAGHACALTYDSNWGTYGQADAPDNQSTVYLNYTKPTYSHNAVWEIKADAGTENLTVPAACFSQSKLRFKVVSDWIGIADESFWYCYNGTSYVEIDAGVGGDNGKVYEEAIYWNETVEETGVCGTTNNACSVGSLNDLADTTTQYNWECLGLYGGGKDTCSLAKIQGTLGGVGAGLGNLFDSLGNPLANFLILVGLAGGVVALFGAVGYKLKEGF
jgi:hypothetical protein